MQSIFLRKTILVPDTTQNLSSKHHYSMRGNIIIALFRPLHNVANIIRP